MTDYRKNIIRRGFSLFLFFLAGTIFLQAQELNTSSGYAFKDNWALEFQPGFSQFYGDASNHNYFQKFSGEIDLAAELSARKMFIPALGAGIYLSYAGLKSLKDKKADGTKVNFSLGGNYYDAGVFLYVNFNHLFAGYKPGRRFSVYGTLGAGWAFWDSWLTDGITGIILRSGTTIKGYTYKTNAFVVPVGLGLNWRISNHWAVNIGGTLRTVMNDDVDVWHDGFKYDQILTTQIGVTYHIRPGWGTRVSGKKKSKQEEICCNEDQYKDKAPIPIYDYDAVPLAAPPVVKPVTKAVPPRSSVPAKENISSPVAYRIQILAVTQPVSVKALQNRYHLPFTPVENRENRLYRYTVGNFSQYSEALSWVQKIRNLGIHDAFVVAYRNGHRVPLVKGQKKPRQQTQKVPLIF